MTDQEEQGRGEPGERMPLVAWAVIAAHLAAPFMFSAVAVALPALGAEFTAGASALGLVENLFLAGSVAFLLPVGRLADVCDRRALYRGGLLLFGAASLGIAFAGSMMMILALRLVQGSAAAVISATGPAILADVVPPQRRGTAYGAAIGFTYAGLALGPLLGGLLVESSGWRSVFIAGAGLLLLAYGLVRRLLPARWSRPPAGTVHLPSVGLVVAAIFAIVSGAALVHTPLLGGLTAGLGVLLFAGFIVLQHRLERPLMDIQALVRNWVLRTALLVQALLYMNAYAALFMMSIYLQVSLGRSPSLAGQIIAVGSVLMAVFAPLAGALSDRLRPTVLASFGTAGVLLSALLALGLGPGSSMVLVVAVLVAQGIGFAFFSSPNMTTIMNSVPPRAIGEASGLGAASRSLGMICGMLATSVLLAWTMGETPVTSAPERFVVAMGSAYIILAIAAAIALIVCVRAALRGRGGEPGPDASTAASGSGDPSG